MANGVVELLMLLKKLLQKNYCLLKSCLQQLYLNKMMTQLLHLVFMFTPAKATNSIANGTNSFTSRKNSFANGTKSTAKRMNSIAKTCKQLLWTWCLVPVNDKLLKDI